MKTKVTISAKVDERSGKRDDGSRWFTREQVAFLHEPGQPYPTSCKIRLEEDQKPYAAGDYETDALLMIGDFNRLRVSYDLGLERVGTSKG